MPDGRQERAPDLRASRRGSVRCVGCRRPVGLVWFGAGPELVELVPARCVDAQGVPRMALLIHRCPAVEHPPPDSNALQNPSRGAASDQAEVRRARGEGR